MSHPASHAAVCAPELGVILSAPPLAIGRSARQEASRPMVPGSSRLVGNVTRPGNPLEPDSEASHAGEVLEVF